MLDPKVTEMCSFCLLKMYMPVYCVYMGMHMKAGFDVRFSTLFIEMRSVSWTQNYWYRTSCQLALALTCLYFEMAEPHAGCHTHTTCIWSLGIWTSVLMPVWRTMANSLTAGPSLQLLTVFDGHHPHFHLFLHFRIMVYVCEKKKSYIHKYMHVTYPSRNACLAPVMGLGFIYVLNSSLP